MGDSSENINERVIYSICVQDLQAVAKVNYGRELTAAEIEFMSEKIGDYYSDWFDALDFAISDTLDIEPLDEPDWDEYPY